MQTQYKYNADTCWSILKRKVVVGSIKFFIILMTLKVDIIKTSWVGASQFV